MAGNDVSISVQVRDNTSRAFSAITGAVRGMAATALIPAAAAAAAYGAQLAAAGAAVGVFGAAVAPQKQAITDAADAQDKYNEAVEKYGAGSKEALAAQQELKAQMDSMPAATQDTARAFIDLKGAYGSWSDSLAGDTMPVFTTAMRTLQGILPKFSPLVKDVAAQFQTLATRFQNFSKTKEFDELVQKFNEFAAGSLKNVISGAETLARTIAGWVMSDGFQEFIRMGAEQGPGIVEMFKNLAEVIGKFIAAAGPIAGLNLKILQILAEALNAIPLDVLEILVPTIFAVVAAIKLWTIATTAWAAAQAIANAVMLANPIVWIIGLVVALVAVIVLIATKTDWFQRLWSWAWETIKSVAASTVSGLLLVWEGLKVGAEKVIEAVKGIIDWVGRIVGKTIQLAQQGAGIVVAKAKEIIDWVKNIVGKTISLAQQGGTAVVNKAKEIIGKVGEIVGKTITLAQRGGSAVVTKVGEIIGGVRSMAGKTIHIGITGVTWAINKVSELIDTVGGLFGKTINIGVNFFKGVGSKLASALGFARGGIVGAQGGGPRSNMTLVGEYGPELVDLAPGSRVRSNADSRRFAAGMGGGGGPIVIQLQIAGRDAGEFLLDPLRQTIHARGGNVQAVLGRA
ncbi:hypothetical protein [Streptomyces chartreusis]